MAAEPRILKSWKEIAAYLGVGVRTAQRWKHRHGLPARQPGTGGRSAVFAFCDEVDSWLKHPSGSGRSDPGVPTALAQLVATETLWERRARPRQLEPEMEAILDLARLMATQDQRAVLRKVASYALTICKAETAGFSILETDRTGKESFRWTATSGRMRAFEGGTTPANFSPCGFCLERNSPQLFRNPEKFYEYLKPIAPVAELLLIPMHHGNSWVGTVWVISHHGRRKFDPEDARLMMQFGSLASATFARATGLKRDRASIAS
jgi:excisionase family DNA binding protein